MAYVIYDPQKLTETLKIEPAEHTLLHRDDMMRPVLYFYADADNVYRPATSIKTYEEKPDKDGIDAFETNGLPRLLFTSDETHRLLEYCRKKSPGTQLDNLPDFFKKTKNSFLELQNCFGVDAINNNRKYRLSGFLNGNIDLRKLEKTAAQRQQSTHYPSSRFPS